MKYLVLAILLIVSFLTGRLTANKLSSKEVMVKNEKKLKLQTQVHSISDVKKDSTTVKLTAKKEIYYSPSGKVNKVVITDESLNSKLFEVNENDITKNTFKESDEKNEKTQKESYLPNWALSLSAPLSQETPYFKSSPINLQVGYRIVGTTYINISSTLSTFQPQIGFTILL